METYNYDNPVVTPGFGPEGDVTPALPDTNVPAAPGFSPSGDVTPSLPSNGWPNVGPGFGPSGDVMPSLPTSPSGWPNVGPGFGPSGDVMPSLPTSPSACLNCTGGVVRPGNATVLWTWGTPFFSTSGISRVRFYNAAAIQEPLDLYLNGRLVVSNLEYMNITNFLNIVPGVYRFTVYRRTNPGYPIIDTGVQFRGNTSYTLTILGTVNNFSVQLISS